MQELPHNISAEKALLGALISDNEALEQVAEYLKPDHFSVAEHCRIYEEIKRLVDENKTANNVTLTDLFTNEMADVGGTAYLAELIASTVTVLNCGEYGKIIFDLAQKRELAYLSDYIAESIGTQQEHGEIIETVERELTALTDDNSHDVGTPTSQVNSALADIEAAYRGEKPPGVPTGILDLDEMIGGLKDGKLYVPAGRPAMGKTILAVNAAESVTNHKPGIFFTLEMSAEELHKRRISSDTGIDYKKIEEGKDLTADELKRVIESGERLKLKPFFIDDTPGVSVEYIKRHARRIKRKHGLGFVGVDYVQLMSGDKSGNREQEISSITRNLKTLSLELKCPVVAVSQLSRAVEAREDKRPRMSDLRESGSIEQDADVILFLFREEYYLEMGKPTQRENETADSFGKRLDYYAQRCYEARGKAEVIIAKHRGGPTGMIDCGFDGAHMRFTNITKDY